MTVSARFYVESYTRRAYNPDHVDVTLQAAGRGEQNKTWAKFTPSGTITMSVNNPAAAKFFEDNLGRDLAITFDTLDGGPHVAPHSPE